MGTAQATAEVFLAAFKALPKHQRNVVIERFLRDKTFREDVIDIAILERRRREPARSLDQYLARRAAKTGA